MKRMNTILLLVSAALFFLTGCTYHESFSYTGVEAISFERDSIYYSFGEEPFSVQDKVLDVRVEIIGRPADHDRSFKIAIDEKQTTAMAPEHYDALLPEYTIPAGECFTIIPVTVHRLELDTEKVYDLKIDLVANENFELGAVECCSHSICFSNRLDCPVWWNELSYWLGEYHVRKYQKFIELYGRPITQHDVNSSKYSILRVFKEVKIYFEAHPEYGIEFPQDAIWQV